MIPTDSASSGSSPDFSPEVPEREDPAPSGSTAPAGSPTTGRRRLVLLAVDDCAADLHILRHVVAGIGEWDADLLTSTGPAECMALLESHSVDVLLIDYVLGTVSGVELLREIRKGGTPCPAIFLTVHDDARAAVAALQAGAADFLPKDDLTSTSLRRAIEAAIEKQNLQLAISDYRRRLERAKESLERRNQELQKFYRTITRELASPLGTAIEVLKGLTTGGRGELTRDQEESVQSAADCCRQVAVGLDDLLDTGRLETGRMALWLRPDDLGDVVQRAAATLAARADSAGVRVAARTSPHLRRVWMDRQRVTQVLTNLVDRALEFTPAGGRIEIEADEDPCDPGFVAVSVTDSGPGLSEPEVTRILTGFCRGVAEAGPQQAHELDDGLALCHEVVHLHGGEITVASEAGVGTTFSFTLPRAAAAEEPTAA